MWGNNPDEIFFRPKLHNNNCTCTQAITSLDFVSWTWRMRNAWWNKVPIQNPLISVDKFSKCDWPFESRVELPIVADSILVFFENVISLILVSSWVPAKKIFSERANIEMSKWREKQIECSSIIFLLCLLLLFSISFYSSNGSALLSFQESGHKVSLPGSSLFALFLQFHWNKISVHEYRGGSQHSFEMEVQMKFKDQVTERIRSTGTYLFPVLQAESLFDLAIANKLFDEYKTISSWMRQICFLAVFFVYITRSLDLPLPESMKILRESVYGPSGHRMAVIGALVGIQMLAVRLWLYFLISKHNSIGTIGFMQLLNELKRKPHDETLFIAKLISINLVFNL